MGSGGGRGARRSMEQTRGIFAQQLPSVEMVTASLLCKRVRLRVRGSIAFPTSLLCNTGRMGGQKNGKDLEKIT